MLLNYIQHLLVCFQLALLWFTGGFCYPALVYGKFPSLQPLSPFPVSKKTQAEVDKWIQCITNASAKWRRNVLHVWNKQFFSDCLFVSLYGNFFFFFFLIY